MTLALEPLYIFVFLGLFSPGPNVILLTTSGAQFGIARTLPHLFGVVLGVGVIAGLTGYGLGAMLLAFPVLKAVLNIISVFWILWIAWALWCSQSSTTEQSHAPMTFVQAVLFQWVNPKIWAVALAAVSTYPSGLDPMREALKLGATFSGTNFFVCLFWTSAGALLSYLLNSPFAWRLFMRAMALALAAFSIMLVV